VDAALRGKDDGEKNREGNAYEPDHERADLTHGACLDDNKDLSGEEDLGHGNDHDDDDHDDDDDD
jgi:hypothetical protein